MIAIVDDHDPRSYGRLFLGVFGGIGGLGGGGRHDLYRLPMTCVCSVLRSKFGIGYFEELTHQSRPQKRFRDVGKWLVGSLFFWLPKTLI